MTSSPGVTCRRRCPRPRSWASPSAEQRKSSPRSNQAWGSPSWERTATGSGPKSRRASGREVCGHCCVAPTWIRLRTGNDRSLPATPCARSVGLHAGGCGGALRQGRDARVVRPAVAGAGGVADQPGHPRDGRPALPERRRVAGAQLRRRHPRRAAQRAAAAGRRRRRRWRGRTERAAGRRRRRGRGRLVDAVVAGGRPVLDAPGLGLAPHAVVDAGLWRRHGA